MSLPTKTFTVSWRNPGTGVIEDGQFTTRKLSIRDMSQIGTKTAQLSGGMHCVRDDNGVATGQGIDEETEFANKMIAHLEISLVQKPVWFNLSEMWDLDLLHEVYGEVAKFEGSFKSARRNAPGDGGVGQAGGGGERPPSVPGNGPTKVVGQEVSASLDA
jgi:hypothetical protein